MSEASWGRSSPPETARPAAGGHRPGPVTEPAQLDVLYDFTRTMAGDPRVARVESIVDLDPRLTREQYALLYANPELSPDLWARGAAQALAEGNHPGQRRPGLGSAGDETKALVKALRATEPAPGWGCEVTGATAGALDLTEYLYRTSHGGRDRGPGHLPAADADLPLGGAPAQGGGDERSSPSSPPSGPWRWSFRTGPWPGCPARSPSPPWGTSRRRCPSSSSAPCSALHGLRGLPPLPVREAYLATGDNARSVAIGLEPAAG